MKLAILICTKKLEKLAYSTTQNQGTKIMIKVENDKQSHLQRKSVPTMHGERSMFGWILVNEKCSFLQNILQCNAADL